MSPDRIEFANAFGRALDISGWTVTLYDQRAWPEPTRTFIVPSDTICRAGEVSGLEDLMPRGMQSFIVAGTMRRGVVRGALVVAWKDAIPPCLNLKD